MTAVIDDLRRYYGWLVCPGSLRATQKAHPSPGVDATDGCAAAMIVPTCGMGALSQHDFDFIFGRWDVRNRKLRDVTDPECDEWVEFDAQGEAFPILGGQGHVDRLFVPDPPDGPPFEGFTLRLYHPAENVWRIWWSSTRAPGTLELPVVGRFTAKYGRFECDEVIRGTQIKVRFEWRAHQSSPTWSQSFSYDAGQTWRQNWEMNFERIDDRAEANRIE